MSEPDADEASGNSDAYDPPITPKSGDMGPSPQYLKQVCEKFSREFRKLPKISHNTKPTDIKVWRAKFLSLLASDSVFDRLLKAAPESDDPLRSIYDRVNDCCLDSFFQSGIITGDLHMHLEAYKERINLSNMMGGETQRLSAKDALETILGFKLSPEPPAQEVTFALQMKLQLFEYDVNETIAANFMYLTRILYKRYALYPRENASELLKAETTFTVGYILDVFYKALDKISSWHLLGKWQTLQNFYTANKYFERDGLEDFKTIPPHRWKTVEGVLMSGDSTKASAYPSRQQDYTPITIPNFILRELTMFSGPVDPAVNRSLREGKSQFEKHSFSLPDSEASKQTPQPETNLAINAKGDNEPVKLSSAPSTLAQLKRNLHANKNFDTKVFRSMARKDKFSFACKIKGGEQHDNPHCPFRHVNEESQNLPAKRGNRKNVAFDGASPSPSSSSSSSSSSNAQLSFEEKLEKSLLKILPGIMKTLSQEQ